MKRLLSIAFFVTISIVTLAQTPSYLCADTLSVNTDKHQYRYELNFNDDSETLREPSLLTYSPFDRGAAIGFRTNLLIPLMNLGIDVPMSRHYSMGVTAYMPWLPPTKNNKYCIQALAFRLDGRFWIGSVGQGLKTTPMEGHSIGVSAFCGKYDLEIAYEGNQGRLLGGDIDYTYTTRLGKNGHWRMAFTVAGGFVYLENRPYNVYEPGGRPTMTSDYFESRTWIGPTRLEFCLSYLILRRATR